MVDKFEIANKNKIAFTKGQKIAIDGLIDFIDKPFDETKFVYGLVGAGGVGKTFVTKYILDNCKYSSSVICCTAPTHKACRVFSQALGYKKVETIQSTFGFRIDLKIEDFDYRNPKFTPINTPKIENVQLLVCDEASMLPAGLVQYMVNTCKEHKIKLILIGDASQLPPVKEKRSTAFTVCTKIFELTEIVRQNDTNPIIELLNILRNDIKNGTHRGIEYIARYKNQCVYNEYGEGFTVCNKNKFYELINLKFHDEEYTKNIDKYKIICYTNNCINAWNRIIRNDIIKDADKTIINKNDLMMSYQTIVDDFNSTIINNSEEYIIQDIVSFVDGKYGFKGFMVKFQLVNGGTITKPLFVVDNTDKVTMIKYINVIEELVNSAKRATGGTRTKKWKEYYEFKQKYLILNNIVDNFGRIVYPRDLDYAFAVSAHKSQGSTYDNVFVDMNDMMYDKNGMIYRDINELNRRLYVACSRSKKDLIICYE